MSRRLDILTRHHDRLIEIMVTVRSQITDSARDADLEALRHLRREMVEALAAYQRFVHEEIYEPAQQGIGSAEARRDAQALKIGCIQLQRDYDDFCLRWARRHVLENWPEYRLSANLMMKQVNDHILHVCELRKGWNSEQAA